jgi:predicted nucleotidyltransferase
VNVTGPRDALARLEAASASGQLDFLCARYGAVLLVVFGSVLKPEGAPRDLDIAVRFADSSPDLLGFLDALSEVAGTSSLDLMDLGRADPVAREHALVGGKMLVQVVNGLFNRAQLAAMMERMDTDWLRQIDLGMMAA